jgi:rRNA maturation endonuclease Nob1
MIKCSQCFRLNNTDAHFCNWCGAQPAKVSIPIHCPQCRTHNDPHAKFCSSCGCVIEQPLHVIDARLRNDSSIPASSMIASVR